MALTSFAQVQAFITQVLTQNNEMAGVSNAPHGAFWSSLTYEQFTTGNVPGVDSVKILVVGDANNSNLIQALSGTTGTPFDPNGQYGQMPANGPPYFSQDQINEIAAWINNGCPQ
jgi:hypothetical protein